MRPYTVRARSPQYPLNTENEEASSLHPVVRRVLANRGIDPQQELDHGLSHLQSPDQFKDIERAASRVVSAIERQQTILIVGDYDADGATSTALAIKALRDMGHKRVSYTVPDRFHFGYGLSKRLAEQIAQSPPELIITVDNGISSLEGIALLKASGVDVVVTDHHLAGETLPEAYAIVNPNQPGCAFPDKSIAGVGVMFYLLLVINRHLRQSGYYQQSGLNPDLLSLLDLVALGTVADVVALGRNNRILVAQGVARMRSGRMCPGIAALMEVAGRDYRTILAQDLGFVVGPRLNAAGRLEDISSGIECLLSTEAKQARMWARALDEINRSRKEIEQSMQNQALESLKTLDLKSKQGYSSTVLYDDNWHEGVVGLVASRVKEKTGLPSLVFAPGESGILKGSARSIPEVHIRDVLANIDAQYPRLIDRFGGHAMAAGLSIKPAKLESFRNAFYAEVEQVLANHPPDNVLLTDGTLAAEELNQSLAELLGTLLPWGQACPEPLFEGDFEIISSRFVGEVHLKLLLRLVGCRESVDAICFRYLDDADSVERREALELKKIHTVYSLDINHFRGRKSLQLMIRHLQAI